MTESLLTPECGPHCGVDARNDGVTLIGHCEQCHNATNRKALRAHLRATLIARRTNGKRR